jgi:helicase-like protein
LEFTRLRTLLERDDALPWEELAEARRLILELNTLSGVLTRTRKADVPDKRAVREPVRIDVAWSEDEAALYRQIMSWTHLRALKNGHPPGFAMQMPLRQAASCLPAMLEQLKARNPEASGAEALADFDEDSQVKAGDLDQWVDQALVQLIRTANTPTKDSKLEAFLGRLDEARRNGLGQMMVFSFFRRTLEYLRGQLSQEGWKVRVMHGGTAMKDRARIMQEFRDGAFEVLLCSEVASEGLDFEFCNVLVNYDLPWNPMKVEQRIGRLDRFGQQHDKIFIYNFHVPGTIETDIFERLYDRINVFRESIGELEPILRDEFGDLHREALDLALSPEQLEARMAEIELAIVNRRVDLANLADAEDLLSAVDEFLIDGLERDTQQRGRFLGKRELRRFVGEFLWTATRTRLPGRDDEDRTELVGDSDLADALTRILSRSPRDLAAAQPFLRRLRYQEPINLTFDNEDANRTSFELVSIRHPLVRAATLHTADRDDLRRYGSVRLTRKPPAEDHVVVVYLAETTGLRGSLELWPVTIRVSDRAVVDDVGDRLFQALTEGSFADAEPLEPAVVSGLAVAAGDHVHRIQAARETERRRDNEALVSARMEAQRASIELKIARAQQRLADARAAGHRQIARLHEGHIANLRARLDQSLDELARRRNLAVTVAPVAVISLRGKNRVR